MEQEARKIGNVIDLNKTKELFDVSIKRGGALGKGAYTNEDIKKQRIVLGYGDLHVRSARVKLSTLRIIGYKDSLKATKSAIEHKIRDARKRG